MNGAASMGIQRFLIVYLLLVIVLAIMKRSKISQTKLLITASLRMTVQLILAGFVLTYIFENPHPLFTAGYLTAMMAFAVHRVLSGNRDLNGGFRFAIGASLCFSGLGVLIFFVAAVVNQSLFNPQYVIPLSGMIFGNAMTGVNLGVKAFRESTSAARERMEALLNFGASPRSILLPFVNQAVQTAILPTLNSMIGMGIVSLPGLMTGQILSGTLPATAILYQISIMVAICTVVCMSVYGALNFGYKTLFNRRCQFCRTEGILTGVGCRDDEPESVAVR